MGAVEGQAWGGASRALAWTGASTAAVYLATFLFYVRGFKGYTRTAREVFIWLAVLPLLYLFWRGYRIVRDAGGGVQASRVVWFAALFCVTCAAVYPFHSTDVFGYINRGWQQAHYQMNPYVHTVAEVPGWREDPIKAANVAAYAFTGWLVWSGARHLGHERPLLALYSFLWNPLVLLHHIANGHNDILIGCSLALAAYLVVTGREVWVLPALAAAVMLKYAPVLLAPAALVYVFRRRGWKAAALGCLLAALVVLASAAPFLADWRQIRLEDIRGNATLIDNSLHSFLIHIYTNLARLVAPLMQFKGAVSSGIKAVLSAGFAAFLVLAHLRFLRRSSAGRLLELWALVLLVLMCAASSKFNAWSSRPPSSSGRRGGGSPTVREGVSQT